MKARTIIILVIITILLVILYIYHEPILSRICPTCIMKKETSPTSNDANQRKFGNPGFGGAYGQK